MANKPIFFDATGRRATHISRIGWVAAILSTLVGIAFLASLIAIPHFNNLKLPGQLTGVPAADLVKKAESPGLLNSAARLAADRRLAATFIARATTILGRGARRDGEDALADLLARANAEAERQADG